ncbi:TolB domain-containing protein [Desulfobulbus propionicus DSM 2032]|uniref:TolB domain-containing protein n=1 Tax=Desulfobulbus propionicus (strain ATCC 33891 / DSM 2032 / VKM B-1956 / 1pr3) TaxID=577650 RepID=A0A7U3YMY9_DESPD|nr:TolB domain-containing protein [Desulfobulbus propionicus DSM 2032]
MKRRHSLFTVVILAVSFLSCLSARNLQAEERTYYDISASDVRKIMVAVPNFSGSGGNQGAAVAQLLTKGLELHGFIGVIDSSRYGGSRDADWKSLGADYVVLGQVSGDPAGIAVEGQILDVASNASLAGRRFKGSAAQLEDMTLRLCDTLIQDFTGEMGVARTRIAYVSDATGRKEVYISDILGRHPRQVTRHRALCVSPRFTPDGNYLAYSTYHRGNQDLYITDLRQNTATNALSRRNGLNLAPTFSPDGRTMVVTLSKGGNPDLYSMDRQGNIIRQLTSGAGINVSASYSPDGQTLAFVSDRSGKPNVYVMSAGGGQAKRLTFKCPENSEPVWSPKGDEIAFTGLQGGIYQLFVMDRNGGNVRQLSTGGGNYESPTWSPDGRLLAVTRKSGSRSEICVVSKSGKDVRSLFAMKGNQSYPQWSGRLP